MIAIQDAYRNGLLAYKNWMPNIIAGVIVGIVALPLAMAFAIASGTTPEQGIYTAIVAGLCVGVFGGSRVQIAGPTGAFVVILSSITAKYGIDGLQIATLLAGFILLFMGMIRLGSVIKFIPDPVVVGFTSGIGVIIFVNEIKDFFGLPIHFALDAHFYEKIGKLFFTLPQLNFNTTALGCLSLILILIMPKLSKRIPGPLVAMIAGTTLQAWFGFSNVATIGSVFGGLSEQLPSFQIPSMSLDKMLLLIGPAFTIALLGAIESLLSATAADAMADTRHDSNQELIGQGIANLFAPLFGGFAATGAIARTATNIRNGGNSPIAAITHCAVLLAVIVFLSPLAVNIPLCTLAAILFVVAYNMSDIPRFTHMIKRAPRSDIIVLITTFILTIFTDLVIAVNIGVILAMLLFVRRMAISVSVEQQTHKNLHQELVSNGFSALSNDILVYSIQGPFFFGVAEKIERALLNTGSEPKIVIFRLNQVPFMDITGLETFQELIEQYYKHGIKIYLCEAKENVTSKLKNYGILQKVSGHCVFATLVEVLNLEMPKSPV